VYLENLASTPVMVERIALSGANPGDFTMTQTCGGTLGFALAAKSSCTISPVFSPQQSSTGKRSAKITITPASSSPLTIQLTGSVK
jgi:hypothetical protein